MTQAPSEGPGPQLPLFSVAVIGVTLTGLGFVTLGFFTQVMNIGFGIWFTEGFVFFGVPYLTMRLSGLDALRTAGLGKPWAAGALFGFVIGVVNFFALVIPLQELSHRLASPELVEMFDGSGIFKHQSPLELASVMLGVCIAAPLCEELCFRGLLQQGLATRTTPRVAVIATALLFSAFHLDPIGFLARFELGLVFGILALRSGSIWPGVFAHLANNAVSTALYLGTRGLEHADDDLPWWAALVMVGVGVPLLAALALASRQWSSVLAAPDKAVTVTKPVQVGELLLQWSVAGLAAIVLLITVDPNGVRLNLHDAVNPLKEPKKTDGEKAQKDWDALWVLRGEARAGRVKLVEYENAREELAKARVAGDAGTADAGIEYNPRPMRTLLVVLAFPAVAAAQPMDLYGFNPRAVAMAGVEAASDGNFTAAYYNPALLRGGEVGIGFNWGSPSMSIAQQGEALPNQELSAQRPVDYAGITVGAAVPLGGLLKGKATIGLAVYSPIRHVFRSHLIDEGTAYFLRYDSAPERLQLALSLAVHPISWLSIGAGFQVSSNYGGAADFSAVLGTTGPGRVIRRRLDSDVIGAAGPIVGVAAGPFKTVRIFGFWRGELKTEFTQPINVDLGTFGSLDVLVRGITQYTPHAGGLGASIALFSDRLLIAADVSYEAWSATPQLVPVITINLPQTLQDLAFNARVDSRELQMGFSDIVVPRVGAEWRQGGRLKIRAGYFYRPTMIPPQTGKSNFLDSNAHVISLGAGWSFDDPLKMADAITLDVAGQVTALEGGTVVKDGPNNNPNYSFGGTHVDLGIAVKYEL